MLIALFEFAPGKLPCWVWYDCQTAIRLAERKVPSDAPSAADIIRTKLSTQFPCPAHNPGEWAALGLPGDGSISRIGRVSDVGSDSAAA